MKARQVMMKKKKVDNFAGSTVNSNVQISVRYCS